MPAIGRQKPGTIPPVKMMGKGQETPASWPSMSNWTSRKGEYPKRGPISSSKVLTSVLNTLVYQNSSVAWPHAESDTTARSAFWGI